MYVQRLGNVLLPGITGRVERLRYFGMVCAGIELTRPASWLVTDPRTAERWRKRFLPFEAGWALATVVAADGQIKDTPPVVARARLKREYQGLRGANRVLDYFRRTRNDQAVKPSNYTLLIGQEAQGGLGAYLVALRRYGFMQAERFELTMLGSELARQFLSGVRHPERLLATQRVARRDLRRLGEAISLARNPIAEAELVRAAVFQGEHETATVLQRIPRRLRWPEKSEEAMQAIARPDGDPLERAAQFALDFDPFRRSALTLFAHLGSALIGRAGPVPLHALVDGSLEENCEELQRIAVAPAASTPPPGLEPVVALAQRITSSRSCEEVIGGILAFHRQEGRRWIESVGHGRVTIVLPGRFDLPREGFHGYTFPSALRVYRDIVGAT
jgi:hypothetical protein